ncbi:unnamed protein product, partial [Bubo scandiacus]
HRGSVCKKDTLRQECERIFGDKQTKLDSLFFSFYFSWKDVCTAVRLCMWEPKYMMQQGT